MRVITVRRSGVIYILTSIVMGVLAINGGNNFHYLAASAILGYMLASGVAGRRNIRGASVTLAPPDEIYAGAPFMLAIDLRNTSRCPIFLIEVEVAGERAFFPVVQPGEAVRKFVTLSLPSRGVVEMRDAEVSSTYPFDLFTRFWPVSSVCSAVVFPAPEGRLSDGSGYMSEDVGELSGRFQKLSADCDIVGVRPYSEGDPMRAVHWKSSARTGKLNTRIYDGAGNDRLKIIDVDLLVQSGVESGLSSASREILESMKSGEPIGMKLKGAITAPSPARPDKLSMLTSLALYE
jgi:uncharacterized protein (DUF58 family)